MSGDALAGQLQAGIDELVDATDRLLETVDQMGEDDPAHPSLLPGWTRAHVLTHLARSADGMVRLARSARTGEDLAMYEGGRPARDADIEAGAGRHLGDLRLDVAESSERLLAALADFPAEALEREVTLLSGATGAGWEIPHLRLREVEIHHVDLGCGYVTSDWSRAFATRTLDQLSPLFRTARQCPVRELVATDGEGRWEVAAEGPEASGPAYALAAWLTGRGDGAGLTLSTAGGVPPAPRWV